MTDYAELRAALGMGPTPGPWKASPSGMRIKDAEGRLMYEAEWRPVGVRKANAAYVAACDPDTIRALLAERDRLATTLQAEVEALRAEVNGTIRALLAERDALRVALEMMVKAGEMNGVGRAYAMKVARAALAQGQEEA